MRGQAGFWDIDERYVRLSAAGDPLGRPLRGHGRKHRLRRAGIVGKGRNTARHGSTEAHLPDSRPRFRPPEFTWSRVYPAEVGRRLRSALTRVQSMPSTPGRISSFAAP